MRRCKVCESDIPKAGLTISYQDRRAIQHQPIDQPRAQEGAGGHRAAFDDQAVAIERGDILRSADDFPPLRCVAAAEHDAPGAAAFEPRQTHIQPWRICADRASADQYCIAPGAFEMGVRACRFTRDPATAAIRHRDTAIE